MNALKMQLRAPIVFNNLYVRGVSRLVKLLRFVKPLCKQLLLALYDNGLPSVIPLLLDHYRASFGGRHPPSACSITAAATRTVSSSFRRPTTCTPIGSPSDVNAAGTQTQGR